MLQVQYQLAHVTQQQADALVLVGRVWAIYFSRWKQFSYKTEGRGGGFVSGSGNHIIVGLLFAQSCADWRTKLKNWPMLEHSPGAAACSNIETSTDSRALQGVMHARVGGGCIEN
jgi:hypothetical protein